MQSLFDLSASIVTQASDFETLQQHVPEEVLRELKLKRLIPEYCSKAVLSQEQVIKEVEIQLRAITQEINRRHFRHPIDQAFVLVKKRTRLSLFIIYNLPALQRCEEVTKIFCHNTKKSFPGVCCWRFASSIWP
jgi:hypothetical protein